MTLTARIAAAIAAACTTTLLFTFVLSLAEPEAVASAAQIALGSVE